MARVVNTDTSLSRRAPWHALWLGLLCLVGLGLVANLGRGVVHELGGIQHIRQAGLAHVVGATAHHVFGFPGGHLPAPHSLRHVGLLTLHLAGLVAIGQMIWLPLSILRCRAGEQQVLHELERLPDEYWVLTDLRVPGLPAPSQVDHVLVSPYGLWCVESKRQPGFVVGGEYDYEWLQLNYASAPRKHGNRFFNPVRKNATHCAHLTDYLMHQRLDAPVRSIVVFTSAELDIMAMTPVERLGNVRDAIVNAAAGRIIEPARVEQIVGALSSLLATRARPQSDATSAPQAAACVAELHGS